MNSAGFLFICGNSQISMFAQFRCKAAGLSDVLLKLGSSLLCNISHLQFPLKAAAYVSICMWENYKTLREADLQF